MPSSLRSATSTGSSGAADERLKQLAKACEPGTPTFLLVDPLVGDPVEVGPCGFGSSIAEIKQARAAAWGRDVVPVKLPATIELAPIFYPYLVALHGAEDPCLEDSLVIADSEAAAGRIEGLAGDGSALLRIGGWLHSSAHGEQIAQVLSECLRVRCESTVLPRYQRLVDRRTFGWARCVAGDERVRAMLGPIQRWTYLGPTGEVNELARVDKSCVPIKWSASEWVMFMRGGLVHQTLARYVGELTRQGLKPTGDERGLLMRADGALARVSAARQLWPSRFRTSHDDTAWAALLLLHGDVSTSSAVDRMLAGNGIADETLTMHDMASRLNELFVATD